VQKATEAREIWGKVQKNSRRNRGKNGKILYNMTGCCQTNLGEEK
jgi:hypothetical protein